MKLCIFLQVGLCTLALVWIIIENYNRVYHGIIQPALTWKYTRNEATLCDTFFDIFPKYDTIVHPRQEKVNVNRRAGFEVSTLQIPNIKKALKDIANNRWAVDELLSKALERIHCDGNPVRIECCHIIDIIIASSGAFPTIHTDIEWRHFPNDGFQLWYLLENNQKHHGNMFVFDVDAPVKQGQSNILLEGSCFRRTVDQVPHERIPFNKVNPSYVGITPGDCLVFGQNVYHMSDVRKSRRTSATLRVALKRPHDRFTLAEYPSLHDAYSWYHFMRYLKYGNRPNRYEYSGMFGISLWKRVGLSL